MNKFNIMDRREFFKKGILAGVAAGAAVTLGDFGKVFAGKSNVPGPSSGPAPYDLVAVKDGEPEIGRAHV